MTLPIRDARRVAAGRLSGAMLGVAVVLAAYACVMDAVPPEPTVRDSAGIVIVENPYPQHGDSVSWSVDAEPAASIGRVDGEQAYLFSSVTGFVRLSDGRIAIGDFKTSQVRFFDSNGVFLESRGRGGKGPEEFQSVIALFPWDTDSLVILDYGGGGGGRATILDPKGRIVRAAVLPRAPRGTNDPPTVRAVFDDGSVLTDQYVKIQCQQASSMGGICEDARHFRRVDVRSGAVLAEYGPLVQARYEQIIELPDDRHWIVMEWQPPAFVAVRGMRFYHADTKTAEIRIFDPSGRLERIVRVPLEGPEPHGVDVPTPGASTPLTEYQIKWNAMRARAMKPEQMHGFTDFQVDDDGNLWLRENVPAGEATQADPRWWVLDSTGVVRYTVRTPDLAVRRQNDALVGIDRPRTRIGTDHILALVRDSLDVESVRLFRLRKRDRE